MKPFLFLLTLFLSLFYSQFGHSQSLVINELLVKNNLFVLDEDLDPSVYVEFYNTASSMENVSSYSISDRAAIPGKWTLPNISVAPNGFFSIYLSDKNLNISGLHSNFKLGVSDTLFLYKNGILIETILPRLHHLNISYGRFPNGSSTWSYQVPSFNTTNSSGVSSVSTPISSLVPGLNPANSLMSLSATSNCKFSLRGRDVNTFSQNYIGGYLLSPLVNNPNYFSLIRTNPSQNFPVADYSESRANNRGWLPPIGDQGNIYLFRARNFYSGGIVSEELVVPIFLTAPSFGLPVIVITTDSINYFGNENGIYVFGSSAEGNYNEKGRTSERLANFHHFDSSGILIQHLKLGTRINGSGGRHSTQKSVRLVTRNIYDTTKLKINGEVISTAILRSGGHRPDCIGRDYLVNKIASNLPMEKANPNLCVVYVNGEYWGIQDLRADVDLDFISKQYKLPKKEIVILDVVYAIDEGVQSNPGDFEALTNFAANNDLNIPSNYDYLNKKIDLDNFINLYATQIFFGNTDFPTTNIRYWQSETPNGESRWRFSLTDLDATFGGVCDTVYRSQNALTFNLQTSTLAWIRAGKLFRAMLTSTKFKVNFTNRFCDLMNSEFNSKNCLKEFNLYKTQVSDLRLEHVKRWRYPSTATTLSARSSEIPNLTRWDYIFEDLEEYFIKRQRTQRNHLTGQFQLGDTVKITLSVSDETQGIIAINTLAIDSTLTGINQNPYPWTGTYFSQVASLLRPASRLGFKFNQWNDNTSLGIRRFLTPTDTNLTANFIADAVADSPRFNEVMAQSNNFYPDQFQQTGDWIELYNPNSYNLYMEGMYLTDNILNPTKYKIPAGYESIIDSNGYITFFCDEATKRGPMHTNFKISSGETIFLIDRNGATILNQLTIPSLAPNTSFAAFPNGTQNFQNSINITPNYNNGLQGVQGLYELKPENNWLIYPNPASQSFTIDTPGLYTIYSLTGQKLKSVTGQTNIDVSEFIDGIYLVKSASGNVQKLVISGE